MKNLNKFFLVILLITLFSCNDSESRRKAAELENENLKLKQQMQEQKAQTEQTVTDLKETTTQLQEQVQQQAEAQELENKAESSPIEYAYGGVTVKNVTYEGTTINSSGPFKQSDIRFISVSCDFNNNVGRAGKTLYGKLYCRILDPYNSTIGNSCCLYQRSGGSLYYTMNKEVSSSSETYYFSSGFGSASGGTYSSIGKYKIEFWFDKDNNSKAYKLTESSFEVY
ncbi:MAG: hypothetical protein KA275_04135 [Chitinophagaceae bacterium]|nr:hypothetical protein [Chitinophagaceae bacterium]